MGVWFLPKCLSEEFESVPLISLIYRKDGVEEFHLTSSVIALQHHM